MKGKSFFDTEQHILFTQWSGKILAEDFIEYIDMLGARSELPRQLSTIERMPDVEFAFEVDKIKEVAEAISRTLKKYDFIRSALVFNQPAPVAYAMLYKEMTDTYPNYQVEIFTTEQAAWEWLRK